MPLLAPCCVVSGFPLIFASKRPTPPPPPPPLHPRPPIIWLGRAPTRLSQVYCLATVSKLAARSALATKLPLHCGLARIAHHVSPFVPMRQRQLVQFVYMQPHFYPICKHPPWHSRQSTLSHTSRQAKHRPLIIPTINQPPSLPRNCQRLDHS